MLLANQHLPDGNQILVQIMSLKINFREKKISKYVHVQMAFPIKNILNVVVFFYFYEILLAGAAIPLFNSHKIIKNLLVKAR